ncbi:ferritin-like domain-containing protein [Phycicoccus sp. Root101]|uniref:ferritin-like domain-containing protein n=1 Tax=Phycicoccus sp. Root101 TaxID=1736421 RepID=UPI0012FC8CDE|nr:ferritin-like domain-containing protein [Phycicoccus sp. Root101]
MVELRAQAKHLHWTLVQAEATHDLLDEVARTAADFADVVAERMRTLGHAPEGRTCVVAQHTSLEPLAAAVGDRAMALTSIAGAIAAVERTLDDAEQSTTDEATRELLTYVARALTELRWTTTTGTPWAREAHRVAGA